MREVSRQKTANRAYSQQDLPAGRSCWLSTGEVYLGEVEVAAELNSPRSTSSPLEVSSSTRRILVTGRRLTGNRVSPLPSLVSKALMKPDSTTFAPTATPSTTIL